MAAMAAQGQNANARQGETAEQYRARVRGSDASHAPGEWFDVIDGFDPVEVKSTQRRLGSGRSGRWRLWRDQHDKMVEQGGEYDLIVLDDGDVWRETTLSADEVSDIISENSLSWTGAGKHGMPAQQVKIPWPYAIEP